MCINELKEHTAPLAKIVLPRTKHYATRLDALFDGMIRPLTEDGSICATLKSGVYSGIFCRSLLAMGAL